MNSNIAEGTWKQIKGKLKEKYANLTDDDLLYAEGKMDQVLGTIQKKAGETRENIDKFINDNISSLTSSKDK